MSDLENLANPNPLGLSSERPQTFGIAGGVQENLLLQLWDHWEVLLAPAVPEIQPNQS